LTAAALERGKLFRCVNKVGRTWGDGMTKHWATQALAFLVTKPDGRDSGFTEDLGLHPEQLW